MSEVKDYYFLNKDARLFLDRGVLQNGQTPEDRFEEIAYTAEKILQEKGFAKKFLGFLKKGFYSLSTPILTNFGNKRGLPISCFGCYIPDTMEGILSRLAEVGIQSKMGGGTAGYFGDLRPRGAKISVGGESSGPIHFLQLFDSVSNVISQGSARRGAFAAYLPVEHPDILDFLKIRDEGNPLQNISFAVCITDQWMNEMIDGDKEKRKIWSAIIKARFSKGYPYIFFTDTVNNNAPQVYKDKGKKIYASQLCSEITLSTNDNESFVCDLSSMNLLHYDDWKNTDAVRVLTRFLDAVMTEFMDQTKNIKFMEAPRQFAINQRALGVGVLGWHSYLQSKMIAFESMEAKFKNIEIFKFLQKETIEASKELANTYGEPELMKGYGLRNSCLMAPAPTVSSSFVFGGGELSQSIEPDNSCYYVKKLAKGSFTYKNPYLKKLLKEYNKDNSDVWDSILIRGGSVQHLDFLSQEEKNVFKTFGEISQKEIVIQAAQRQKYIDQSQSLNLMIPADTKPKDVSDLLIEGWRMGIKTFYYQKSSNPVQELARNILTCESCSA